MRGLQVYRLSISQSEDKFTPLNSHSLKSQIPWQPCLNSIICHLQRLRSSVQLLTSPASMQCRMGLGVGEHVKNMHISVSLYCPCPVSSFFKPSLTGLVPCNRVLSQWRREGSTTVKDLEEDGDKDVAVVGGGGEGEGEGKTEAVTSVVTPTCQRPEDVHPTLIVRDRVVEVSQNTYFPLSRGKNLKTFTIVPTAKFQSRWLTTHQPHLPAPCVQDSLNLTQTVTVEPYGRACATYMQFFFLMVLHHFHQICHLS